MATPPGSGAMRVIAAGTLNGRLCVVSGAGSGIGRAIALRLLDLGANVIGIGRRGAALAETGALAEALPGRFEACSVNVRDVAQVNALFAGLADRDLDLLVNNAGGQFYAPFTSVSRKGWDAVIDLNLSAMFSVTQAAYPSLKRAAGAVVNISISGVDRGMVGAAHALAARAGVLAMTRSLALEWAGEGIRLNCLGPGLVLTEAFKTGARDAGADALLAAVPLGRPTLPEEVAEVVAFLASGAGRLITGQLLQVDGGVHIGSGIHFHPPG